MFIIRIELHNTTNYEPLHAAMAKRGLLRTIPCKDGFDYQLPSGTYYSGAVSTASNVSSAAEGAAAEAGHRNAMIVVADAATIHIANLPLASHYRRYG